VKSALTELCSLTKQASLPAVFVGLEKYIGGRYILAPSKECLLEEMGVDSNLPWSGCADSTDSTPQRDIRVVNGKKSCHTIPPFKV
jgi:hypothetical protein